MIHLKSRQEIDILREANLIVHEVLAKLKSMCQPGLTTLELDRVAEDMTRKFRDDLLLRAITASRPLCVPRSMKRWSMEFPPRGR